MCTGLYMGPEGIKTLSISSKESTLVSPKRCFFDALTMLEMQALSSVVNQFEVRARVMWGESLGTLPRFRKLVESVTALNKFCNSVQGLVPAQIVRTEVLDPKNPQSSKVRVKGLIFFAAVLRLEIKVENCDSSVSPRNCKVRWNKPGSTQRIPLKGNFCFNSLWKLTSALSVDSLSLIATNILFFIRSHNV